MPKTLMGLASLGRLGHILNRYLRVGPAERIPSGRCLQFLWSFLVRSCLGAGDPDNGGVPAIEGLESSVGSIVAA
jgi:hypothetical protein